MGAGIIQFSKFASTTKEAKELAADDPAPDALARYRAERVAKQMAQGASDPHEATAEAGTKMKLRRRSHRKRNRQRLAAHAARLRRMFTLLR